MIRPDEIVTAVGGRVMEAAGVPYLQNGRIGQDNLPTFTRASVAWQRTRTNRWAQLSTETARWRPVEVNGALTLGLTLEQALENQLRYSSVFSSTTSSTSVTAWVNATTSPDTVSSAPSMLTGEVARRFLNAGGSTGHGLYQDAVAASTDYVFMSAIVERDNSTGVALRLRDQGSSNVIMDGAFSWDGAMAATLSTQAGGTLPLSFAENLGWGPNGGRAYRIGMGAKLASGGGTIRATVFPTGTGASTGVAATWVHHVQLTATPGIQDVVVRSSTALAAQALETFTIPAVNVPGGPVTLYQEHLHPGRAGTAGAPTTSTDATETFLALARGWTSTGGAVYAGGGIYNRTGRSVVAGSSAPVAITAGARVEELVAISTSGELKYQVRVDGGAVATAFSTGRLGPGVRTVIPDYTLTMDQVVLLSVLARGVHDLDDFTSLFP